MLKRQAIQEMLDNFTVWSTSEAFDIPVHVTGKMLTAFAGGGDIHDIPFAAMQ